jgi:lipopolysaccharide export system protein LptC
MGMANMSFASTLPCSHPDTGPWPPTVRGESHAAFDAARRHTRRVRILRRALPLSGGAILAAFVVASQLSAPEGLDLSVAAMTIERSAVVMDNPSVTGFDRAERQYRVSADRAVQKIARPQEVRLEAIEAEIQAPGRGAARIRAAVGDYDNSERRLRLSGGITLDSADGYGLALEDADIDLAAGSLVSARPVLVTYEDSETRAERLSVRDGGRLIVLEERVRTRLMPPKRARTGPLATAGRREGSTP